ncbi:MAG: phosphoribosylglycinamide formyltransferase [Gammaproteobacteria bacterium]|nr:MAG: phosphoribosylglycinamide formyltransferase [Gammaproteobacteria bacterium]
MSKAEPDQTCKIAVLISGGGSNLQSIIDHIDQRNINASIACVISNNPDVYGLVRAQQANIPTHIIEHSKHDSREAFDVELVRTLEVYNIKLIILAGFMRVLSPTFINEYPNNILNIHPSLLPKYPGLHTHVRALKAGENEHGCSVHFVTAELDDGPLIIQAKVPVEKTDSAESLAARVLEKEHIIYPLAVKWFCDKHLELKAGKVHVDNLPLKQTLLLSPEYEALLK